jgi:hypothetical protein
MSDIFMEHPQGADQATIMKDALLKLEAHFTNLVEVDESLSLQNTELAQIHREKLDGVRESLLNDYGIAQEED